MEKHKSVRQYCRTVKDCKRVHALTSAKHIAKLLRRVGKNK